MRVFYTDVVAIIDEGVGNSTLSLALDEIISEGMIKVQKPANPEASFLRRRRRKTTCLHKQSVWARAFSHFEKHGFIFI